MDSLITAAARALAAGDPFGALKRIALRDDPPALALRGIAMAQLGDFVRAKVLLRRAARGFGSREPVARARCVVAEAEVALAAREITRGGARGARAARRPRQRRTGALPAGPASRADRTTRRSPADTRRARYRGPAAGAAGDSRAGGCRDRHPAPADPGGAGCARRGATSRPTGGNPRTDRGG